MFKEFFILDSQIEYSDVKKYKLLSVNKKFIIKNEERYLDDFESNTESWIELLKLKKIEMWVSIENMPHIYQVLLNHFENKETNF